MIVIFGFGRRKKSVAADSAESGVEDTQDHLDEAEDDSIEEAEPASDAVADDERATAEDSETAVDSEDDGETVDDRDEWERLDASRDWRVDGPFDVGEVDLDADDVERLDFGCMVLTPFEGMQMQLQVDQKTKRVQAALVMSGSSAIEVALFAAPAHSSMVAEIRQEMIEATEKAGGHVTLVEGPFGTEVRRVIPLTDPRGNRVVHISRTWFAQGPKWLLRGVVMGEAGQASGVDSGTAELLYEFFSNTVVRRDHQPRVPGDLIPMTLPTSLARSVPDAEDSK